MTVSRTRTLVQVAALVAICSLPLAAHTRVAQNSPLGLKTFSTPSHQGFAEANPLIAPGLAESLCHQGVRSRCSAKERDDESGLDYFLARYYSTKLGRFTSVDPENAGASLADPQLWNGYSYVGNNPLVRVDPDGRIVFTLAAVGAALYTAFEVASTALDVFTLAETIQDPNSTGSDIALAAGGLAAGVVVPGPGGTVAKGAKAVGGIGRRAVRSAGKRVALDADKLINLEKLGKQALEGLEGRLIATKQAFKELLKGSTRKESNKLLKRFGIEKDFSNPRPKVRSETFEAARKAGLTVKDAKVVSEARSIGAKVSSRDKAVERFVEEVEQGLDP